MAGTSGAVRAGRAFVELYADKSRLGRDLRQGVNMLRGYASTARAVGQSMFRSGLAIAAPIAIATAIYASFADQMAEVKAVTGASSSAFKVLNDQAKELGRTTSFTATNVASLQTELGRAGFNPSDIIASTQAVLNLSRATRTELGQGAQIAADSLRAFRLETSAIPAVADVLTATVNSSSQTLVDLFEALKTVGPAARDVGQSITQTAAAIGLLANNGIKGTLAGTALKRAYLNLVNPAIQKKLQDLTGVSAVDADRNLRPLADVIADIGEATRDLPNADRLNIFAEVFGDRAVIAGSAFASASANFNNLFNTLENAQGTAERTAMIMDDTLGGSFRMLKSAAEGTAIAIGETLSPSLRTMVGYATNVVGSITAIVKANPELILALGASAAAAITLGAGLIVIGGTLGALAYSMSTFGAIAARTLGALPGLLGAIRSPAKLATAALLGMTAVGSVASPVNAAQRRQAGAEQPQGTETEQQIESVKRVAASAGAEVLPLAAGFAGLRVSRAILGRLVGTMKTVPDVTKRTSKTFAVLSSTARSAGGAFGFVAGTMGSTVATAFRVAELPVRVLAASSFALTATLLKTATILSGKVASGAGVASLALSAAAKSLGSAGRTIYATGSRAVLASTALTRAAGRSTQAMIGMGAVATKVSIDFLALGRAMVAVSFGSAVSGLKRVTQTMGGLTIAAFQTTRALFHAVASIKAASVVSGLAGGLNLAASGFRKLSLASLMASVNIGKVGKAIRSTLALQRIGAMASVAAAGIAGLTASLFAFASSPGVLFAMMAGGLSLAVYQTVGSFGALKAQAAGMANATGTSMRAIASQAATAWSAVTGVARTSLGTIVELIKEGKMESAFNVSMAALKLSWAKTVQSFVPTWAPVAVGFEKAFELIGQFFDESVGGMKKAFGGFGEWFATDGVSEFTSSWADTASTFAELWVMAIDRIKSTWNEMAGGLLDIKDGLLMFAGSDEAGDRISQRAFDDRKDKRDREETVKERFESIEADRVKSRAEDAAAAKQKKENADGDVEVAQAELDLSLMDVEIERTRELIASLRQEIDDTLQQQELGLDVDASEMVADIVAAREALHDLETRRAGTRANLRVLANPVDETVQQGGAALPDYRSAEDFFAEIKAPSGEAMSDVEANKVFGGEKKMLKTDSNGNSYDPETGKTLDEMKAESAADKVRPENDRNYDRVAASNGLDRVQGRLTSTSGTFSGRAAGQIGASISAMGRVARSSEETAKYSKQTAENTQEMKDKQSEAGIPND